MKNLLFLTLFIGLAHNLLPMEPEALTGKIITNSGNKQVFAPDQAGLRAILPEYSSAPRHKRPIAPEMAYSPEKYSSIQEWQNIWFDKLYPYAMTLPETNTIPGIPQANQDAINLLKPTIKLCSEARRRYGANCRRNGGGWSEAALMLAGFKDLIFSTDEEEEFSKLPLPLAQYGITRTSDLYYTEKGRPNALLWKRKKETPNHPGRDYLAGLLLQYPVENIEYFYKNMRHYYPNYPEHYNFAKDKQEAEEWLAQQDIQLDPMD